MAGRTNAAWRRLRQRNGRVALALVAGIAFIALAAAPAAASPGYRLNNSYCKPGRFDSYPPVMYSSYQTNFRNPERVEWSPDLYRWRPRAHRWKLYRSGSWYYAFTSSYGLYQAPLHTAWHAQNGSDIVYVYFSGLPRGYYGVKHYMYWSWINKTYHRWGGYCFVR